MSLLFIPNNSSFHWVEKKNISDLPTSFLWPLNLFSSGRSTSPVKENFYSLLFWGEVNDVSLLVLELALERIRLSCSPLKHKTPGASQAVCFWYIFCHVRKTGLVLTKMTPFSAPAHTRWCSLAVTCTESWQGFYSPHPQAPQCWAQIYVVPFELLKSDNTSTSTQTTAPLGDQTPQEQPDLVKGKSPTTKPDKTK